MSGLAHKLRQRLKQIPAATNLRLSGRVSRFDGQIIHCDGFPARIGALCHIETIHPGETICAELIGFDQGKNLLSVYEQNAPIRVGARVYLYDEEDHIKLGEALLGRVIDALGHPLDDRPPPILNDYWPLGGKPINPLARQKISEPLDVGVRVINGITTVGRGQRVGVIAGSGVGKSVLLGMMSRYTKADIVVVGLIGERGREVGHFVQNVMNSEARGHMVVVAEPADRSSLLRIRAAFRATAIAEYFRAQGKHVLLIMDSLTRVAHAKREIGLALGEHPTSKGYPPSVIALIPQLIERAGMGKAGEGSITGFYTVLADGDDADDPVVDTARAILDGHILLSREQAQMGVYPAIDIGKSISRVMTDITPPEQQNAARRFRRLVTLYLENRELMLMGGYTPGQDVELDEAIQLWPQLMNYIQQEEKDAIGFAQAESELQIFSELRGT